MKSNKPTIAFLTVLLFSTLSLHAQNIARGTLLWQAEEVTDLQTATNKQMSCQFRTQSNSSVEWIQKDGALKSLFTISSVDGQWADVSTLGTITYALERNGKTAKMILEKTASGTFITMDFSKPGEFVSKLRFKIMSVE